MGLYEEERKNESYKINNELDLYVATQYPHYDREEVARCLNLKEEQVNVINMSIGGAFGGREDINPQCHAAIASYLTKRPVKIIYSSHKYNGKIVISNKIPNK